MEKLIKISLIIAVAILYNTTKGAAQSGPVVCKITYDYDVSGNRIKREYKCEATWSPADPLPWSDHTIFTTVFPNPTTGVITGTFSSTIGGDAGGAMITVSTMGGITVFQQAYNQITSSVTIDISQQLSGQYLLTVAAFNKVETYVITKL
ncbi:MAG: T9SS type A sorting domain-containing protein [Limnohabitans sp.]|nr:T9SS type A sorting domain-containing protein [Limnohabitans sp.]